MLPDKIKMMAPNTPASTTISQEGILLPCPFCGGPAKLEEYTDKYDDCTTRVTCIADDCPGAHTWQENEAEAIDLWQRRAGGAQCTKNCLI